MNEYLNREMKELRGKIADNLRHSRKYKTSRRQSTPVKFKPILKTLILGAAFVLVLFIIIDLFSGGSSEIATKNFSTFQHRVDLLEKRLAHFEGLEVKLAQISRQESVLNQSMEELANSGKLLKLRLSELAQKIDALEKGMISARGTSKIPYAIQRRPLSLGKIRYHVVMRGDTLYMIAQQYGTSVEELCRFNNISPDTIIYPGQKLLIASKETQ